uniref:Uncharacterized protein n=1 Tax=Cannabis sativa TaxID=3483 RepID=A0A803PL85_CANSA
MAGDEEAVSRVNVDAEEQDETNDKEYEENQEYDAYDDGSYTELLALRQKVADHEAKLAAQKEQNMRIQDIMAAMQKAMEMAGIHRRLASYAFNTVKHAPQREHWPSGPGGPKKCIHASRTWGKGRKSRKHPPANLRQKLNNKHGDLRNHLEKKKQAIPMLEGTLNEGILAELAILQKDIAKKESANLQDFQKRVQKYINLEEAQIVAYGGYYLIGGPRYMPGTQLLGVILPVTPQISGVQFSATSGYTQNLTVAQAQSNFGVPANNPTSGMTAQLPAQSAPATIALAPFCNPRIEANVFSLGQAKLDPCISSESVLEPVEDIEEVGICDQDPTKVIRLGKGLDPEE